MIGRSDLRKFNGDIIVAVGVSPDDGAFWLKTDTGMIVVESDHVRVYEQRLDGLAVVGDRANPNPRLAAPSVASISITDRDTEEKP